MVSKQRSTSRPESLLPEQKPETFIQKTTGPIFVALVIAGLVGQYNFWVRSFDTNSTVSSNSSSVLELKAAFKDFTRIHAADAVRDSEKYQQKIDKLNRQLQELQLILARQSATRRGL